MQDNNYQRAMDMTKVIVSPKKKIATFWTTSFRYYVLSDIGNQELYLRLGSIDCFKPNIITPDTLMETFEGFSPDDVAFAERFSGKDIARVKVLGYQFKNKLTNKVKLEINPKVVIDGIRKQEKDTLYEVAILSAPNDIWSLSLTKFVMDVVFRSFSMNVEDLEDRGFFLTDHEKQREEVELIFYEIKKNKDKKLFDELGEKLGKYGLFEEYEDKFFKLFRSI